jgi:hypothetical protein
MHARFSPSELAARREIEAKIAAARTEEEKDRLREDRQAITDAARARLKARVAKKNAPPKPPPPPKPEKRVYTLTSAQRWAREHWSNQHGTYRDYPKAGNAAAEAAKNTPPVRSFKFVYALWDGTKFWPWGEVQKGPLPYETRVLRACNPPGYIDGSHVLPHGVSFDEQHFVWRRV